MSEPAAVVRPMEEADLPSILALSRLVPEAPWWSDAHIRQLVAAEAPAGALMRRGWVAQAGSKVSGFIVLQALHFITAAAPELECEIEAIVIDPLHRRKGTGRRLLEASIAWCRQNHASVLRLELRSSNAAALALYTQAGFARRGLRREYYHSPPEDAVLMEIHPAAGP